MIILINGTLGFYLFPDSILTYIILYKNSLLAIVFLINQHNAISSKECSYIMPKRYSDRITGKQEIKLGYKLKL